MRASIFVNYKRYKSKFWTFERTEEVDFDTDKRSFTDVASEILDALEGHVRKSRLDTTRRQGRS